MAYLGRAALDRPHLLKRVVDERERQVDAGDAVRDGAKVVVDGNRHYAAVRDAVVIGADALKHKVPRNDGVASKVDYEHKRLV